MRSPIVGEPIMRSIMYVKGEEIPTQRLQHYAADRQLVADVVAQFRR
jgi:hypothetical protein